ncbi:hypothetical protein FUT12_27120, partial [Bacillus mycoides]|uniref:phosphopantetheine-binding protein n=1 Tax=Bacillus mycoides TaxID=1405 RepID=UPI001879FA78
LNVEKVSRSDNFFEIGGNSLLLISVYGLLRKKLTNVSLTINDLLSYPTIYSLAEYLSSSKELSVSNDGKGVESLGDTSR